MQPDDETIRHRFNNDKWISLFRFFAAVVFLVKMSEQLYYWVEWKWKRIPARIEKNLIFALCFDFILVSRCGDSLWFSLIWWGLVERCRPSDDILLWTKAKRDTPKWQLSYRFWSKRSNVNTRNWIQFRKPLVQFVDLKWKIYLKANKICFEMEIFLFALLNLSHHLAGLLHQIFSVYYPMWG